MSSPLSSTCSAVSAAMAGRDVKDSADFARGSKPELRFRLLPSAGRRSGDISRSSLSSRIASPSPCGSPSRIAFRKSGIGPSARHEGCTHDLLERRGRSLQEKSQPGAGRFRCGWWPRKVSGGVGRTWAASVCERSEEREIAPENHRRRSIRIGNPSRSPARVPGCSRPRRLCRTCGKWPSGAPSRRPRSLRWLDPGP